MARKLSQGRSRNEFPEQLADLFAGFAHEVRNPLSTIGLNLGLIREDFEQPDSPRERRTKRRLEVLQSEVRRMQSILDEFLHFVRGPVVTPRPVELNTLLANLVEFMAPEAADQGISLRCFPDQDVGMFEVDPDKFRAMIVNLVRNALQACGPGDEVLVSTQRQGADVLIRVTDTGPGMDEATQSDAFKPYFSTKKAGTGLGLPIVHRVVEEHGGTIHLSSDEGKGTQFTLLFPAQKLIPAGDGPGQSPGENAGEGTGEGVGEGVERDES